MRVVFYIVAVMALAAGSVLAGDLPPFAGKRPRAKDYPMQSVLYDLDREVNVRGRDGRDVASALGVRSDTARMIHVEIVNRRGAVPVADGVLTRFGGRVSGVWRGRASAWIPADRLLDVARALPDGFYMEVANLSLPVDEGPSVIGSNSYVAGGADGTGITIAIIDIGFSDLDVAQAAGAAPLVIADSMNFDDEGTVTSGSTHGTACLEMVYDHAPGATYCLYRTTDLTHFGLAVDRAITQGVQIISRSLVDFNTGWDDDSGDACAAVSVATAAGILFFNGAGNHARKHWRGAFTDNDMDGWHEWSGTDETQRMPVSGFGRLTMALQWDTTGGVHDLDLHILNDPQDSILASSTNDGNNFEFLSYKNTTGVPTNLHVAVYLDSGSATDLQLFDLSNGTVLQHRIAAGSVISPSNSTEPNCFAVGAVVHTIYGSPQGSDVIVNYSSQGPTNSGNIAPEIVGPTNTYSAAIGGVFGGTSCATPNAAGAAAALWSSVPFMGPDGIRLLVLKQALLLKDWGMSGVENVYGYGGVALHPYYPNTVWMDRDAGNAAGSQLLPFYFLTDAQTFATAGGRIVLLGGSYPEPILLDKALRYEAVGGAVAGAP